jgi:hypothetical protein
MLGRLVSRATSPRKACPDPTPDNLYKRRSLVVRLYKQGEPTHDQTIRDTMKVRHPLDAGKAQLAFE